MASKHKTDVNNKEEIIPGELEPMSNETCFVVIYGYAHTHSNVESLPMDIARLFVSYYSIWFDLKIIYCDAETGAIDMHDYETMSFRIDSQLMLREFAQEIEEKMFREAVKKRYNELLHYSTTRLRKEFGITSDEVLIIDDLTIIDELMYDMTKFSGDDDIDYNDYPIKEIENPFINAPFVHIWSKFKNIAALYPIDKPKATVKEEWFENEDDERWVELPDDYMATKICELKDFDCLVIEKAQIEKPSDWQTGRVTWPRQKGDDWRETLQVGDFVDANDEDNWYESMVRFVYPKDHALFGKCVVHFIGWNIKWDEPLSIDSERIAKRHCYSFAPHRPRKKHYTEYVYSNTGPPPHQSTGSWPVNRSRDDIDLQRAIAASLGQM